MRGIQIKEYVKVNVSLSTFNPMLMPPQGPKDLKITDLPDPTPSEDQYLIQVHASATNFFDLLQIAGKYQHQPPLPWISGSEFSGAHSSYSQGIYHNMQHTC